MKNSKFALMTAFALGQALTVTTPGNNLVRFDIVNRVEREDGSNRSYNVTGITKNGHQTVHIYAE